MNEFRAGIARRSRVAGCIVVSGALLLLTASEAGAAAHFRESSLSGTFAVVGTGDGHTSASVGTARYDGAGNVTRSLLVNAPDGNGGRQVLSFESEGTYEVHPDGTGVVFLTTRIGNGSTTEVTFDIVIQGSQPNGRGGQRRATQIFGVQREPGTTVNLVTSSESLIAP